MFIFNNYFLPLLNLLVFFFFFNDTATTEIYTLSLHDALPIRSVPSSSPVETASLAPSPTPAASLQSRSEEHTSELQSPCNLVCRLLLEKKNHGRRPRHGAGSYRAGRGPDASRRRQPRAVGALRGDDGRVFFCNHTPPTEIYTLSLHDALPIWRPFN